MVFFLQTENKYTLYTGSVFVTQKSDCSWRLCNRVSLSFLQEEKDITTQTIPHLCDALLLARGKSWDVRI